MKFLPLEYAIKLTPSILELVKNDVYLFVVDLEVLFQIGSWSKILPASLTLVGFVSRMDSLMSD